MAIPVGNDMTNIKKQMAEIAARKEAVAGGFRFVLAGSITVTVQPGLFTYAQRRHVREETGESVEHWAQELGSSVGADTMAAIVWVGLFQEHGDDVPTIGEVQAFVDGLESSDIGEIEQLDADTEPALATDSTSVDLSDPKLLGPRSTTSGPLSLPDLG